MEDTQELTPEQLAAQKEAEFWAGIEERKSNIEKAQSRKVFSIVLPDLTTPGERVVGFAYEPDLSTQLRLIDKGSEYRTGFSLEACSNALESLLIKSETDERISNKKDLNYWKGAASALAQFMGVATPILKKK